MPPFPPFDVKIIIIERIYSMHTYNILLKFIYMPIINNSKTDPNKMLPLNYQWARQYY